MEHWRTQVYQRLSLIRLLLAHHQEVALFERTLEFRQRDQLWDCWKSLRSIMRPV